MVKGNLLLTGGNGFLGSYIKNAYEEAMWRVFTLGRTEKNDIVIDLAQEEPILEQYQFDRVIHAAGYAHRVKQINDAVQTFYDVNLHGTNHLLNSLSGHVQDIRQFVYISSVAVYGQETGRLLDEYTNLEGRGAYAQSKILAEEQVRKWGEHYNVPVLILRLPFVAGSNAPGEFQRTLEQMTKPGYRIIGSGQARKSTVLANDVAKHLALWEYKAGTYNLTDGYHPSMLDWCKYIKSLSGSSSTDIKSIPDWVARILSGMGDLIPGFPYHSRKYYHLTSELTFDDDKARKELEWLPRRVIGNDW
jgi:nucleoside-diphosphate-sugar epimerase